MKLAVSFEVLASSAAVNVTVWAVLQLRPLKINVESLGEVKFRPASAQIVMVTLEVGSESSTTV